jgi:hypothetical protein
MDISREVAIRGQKLSEDMSGLLLSDGIPRMIEAKSRELHAEVVDSWESGLAIAYGSRVTVE